jgi:hypothetical protein
VPFQIPVVTVITFGLLGTNIEERISCEETVITESALRSLFAFETICYSEQLSGSGESQRACAINLSIGTAFIDFSDL